MVKNWVDISSLKQIILGTILWNVCFKLITGNGFINAVWLFFLG